ncbi:MAG: NFACT family protein [Candidatus Micrarchaeota archaeon]|nr:NFACT family protein [Candidatus Micrarchaeota archaeon]
MRELSSIELKVVVDNLSATVGNGYLRKFYDLGNGSFRIGFYSDSQNHMLYIRLAEVMNLTGFAEEAGEATQFAMAMRKRIENAKVVGISQKGSDRIVIIGLEAAGSRHDIIIEMFGKGNMILADGNGTIELCYKRLEYADRAIRPKERYRFPKSSSYPFEELDAGKLREVAALAVDDGSKMIVALSKYVNVGPLYMEDAILRAGLDPKAKLSREDEARIAGSIADLFARIKEPRPRAYIEDGKVVDYALADIRKYDTLESKEYGSLDAMLDELHMRERTAVEDPRKRRIEELDVNIAKQRELAINLMKESEELAAAAGKIYENMHMINSIIGSFRSRKGVTLQELRAEFGDIVKGLDLKNKTVIIEVR